MASQYQKLAATLPLRLQRFFRSNPPPGTFPHPSTTTSTTPSLTVWGSPPQRNLPSSPNDPRPNPFSPHKNPETGRWHPPIYSLRQQADLYKLAHAHGVQDLLPPTTKDFEAKRARKEEMGSRIKGTGVGQKVKGRKWERKLGAKLEMRRKAMLEMPAMIERWRRLSHGRRWKGFPKGGPLV